MTDKEKIAQWITSDYESNSPLYVDIIKKVLPLFTQLKPEDINYRIEGTYIPEECRVENGGMMEALSERYLHIFVSDKCYNTVKKHSMEHLITVICTDKIQSPNGQTPSRYHIMHNNQWIYNNSFNGNEPSVYEDTIFNYGYVMKYVRDTKLNTLFSSSKDDVDKEIAGISKPSN
jgi:hypothetical protein